MVDIEFIDGLSAKEPHEFAPDFIKCRLSIKREQLIAWLQQRGGEWVNVDVKESKNGNWYCAVDNWKPKDGNQAQGRAPQRQPERTAAAPEPDFDDDIPF